MCIDCLDAPGDTMPAERELLFTSQISQNVDGALKKFTHCLSVKSKIQIDEGYEPNLHVYKTAFINISAYRKV